MKIFRKSRIIDDDQRLLDMIEYDFIMTPARSRNDLWCIDDIKRAKNVPNGKLTQKSPVQTVDSSFLVFAHLPPFDRSFNLHMRQTPEAISHLGFEFRKRNPLFPLMGGCTLHCAALADCLTNPTLLTEPAIDLLTWPLTRPLTRLLSYWSGHGDHLWSGTLIVLNFFKSDILSLSMWWVTFFCCFFREMRKRKITLMDLFKGEEKLVWSGGEVRSDDWEPPSGTIFDTKFIQKLILNILYKIWYKIFDTTERKIHKRPDWL